MANYIRGEYYIIEPTGGELTQLSAVAETRSWYSLSGIMERGSRDLSGAKDSCSTSGEGAEKDKDVDSHNNESEDEEHSDTHSHSTANAYSGMYENDGDSYRLESISPVKYLEELSESKTVGMISASQISPPGAKDSGGNRKKIGRYFTDRIYLDKMSRQERRRIEGEMIKGRKPGEYHSVT